MHVVPSKATRMDNFAAEIFVEDIACLGHTCVILRSDNEPALLLLVGDALKGLRVQQLDSAAAENSVAHDPQTAGAAEVSACILKCQVRAMHLALDRFLGKHVPVTHPLIAWLVEHAAIVRLTGVVCETAVPRTTVSEDPTTHCGCHSLASDCASRADPVKGSMMLASESRCFRRLPFPAWGRMRGRSSDST